MSRSRRRKPPRRPPRLPVSPRNRKLPVLPPWGQAGSRSHPGPKALAEAEGIRQEAEAMKKYGRGRCDRDDHEPPCRRSPRTWRSPSARWIRSPCTARGNSAKLLSDIVNGTTQVTEGISAEWGWTSRACWQAPLGGKLAAGNPQPVQVTVTPQAQPDAAAASADTAGAAGVMT